MRVRPYRFILSVLWISLLMLGIFVAGAVFFDAELGNAGTSILPLLIAAMIEGQSHVKITETRPSSGEIWRASLLMGCLAMGLSLLLVALVFSLDNAAFYQLAELPASWIVIGAAVLILVQIVICRLGAGLGIRTQLKLNRKARKTA